MTSNKNSLPGLQSVEMYAMYDETIASWGTSSRQLKINIL